MKSQTIAPIQTRSKLPKEVLLQALEAAEKELSIYHGTPIAKLYVSMRDNINRISEEIDNLDFNSAVNTKETKKKSKKNKESEDEGDFDIENLQEEKSGSILESSDKAFDRILTYFKLLGDFADTLDRLHKKISPEDLKAAEESSAKSIVNLVKNKKDL